VGGLNQRFGGFGSIAEPLPVKMEESSLSLFRKYGWKGPYSKLLARFFTNLLLTLGISEILRIGLKSIGLS